MLCKTNDQGNDTYIPVGLDQKLFTSIFQKKFETKFGKYKVKNTFVDWTNSNLIQDREIFLHEKQSEIKPIEHTKELSLLIQNNPIDNLWKKNITSPENPPITKSVSKPFFWDMNIHNASLKGKKSSIEYNLSLIPQLLNLPDSKDNTPVHYAAIGNQKNILMYFHEIGADFTMVNSDGFLPIHLISNKTVITAMKDLGFDINERNANGESLLDIKTRLFDKSMIKAMLGLGVDILEPN